MLLIKPVEFSENCPYLFLVDSLTGLNW